MKNIEIIEPWSKINLRDEKNKGEEFEAKHGLYTHGFESLCPTRSDLIFHPRIPGQRAFPWDDPLFFPCLFPSFHGDCPFLAEELQGVAESDDSK